MKVYSNTNDKCHVCSKGILKERITSSNLVLQYCKKCGYEGGDFYLEWGIEMSEHKCCVCNRWKNWEHMSNNYVNETETICKKCFDEVTKWQRNVNNVENLVDMLNSAQKDVKQNGKNGA